MQTRFSDTAVKLDVNLRAMDLKSVTLYWDLLLWHIITNHQLRGEHLLFLWHSCEQEVTEYAEEFFFFFFKTPFGTCGGRASFINLGTMFSWNIHCCFLVIMMFWTNKAAQWKAFLICFLIFFPNAALLIHLDADQINDGVTCSEKTHASPI